MTPIMELLSSIGHKLKRTPNTAKLVRRGLRLGNNVSMQFGVIIDHSHCHLIQIGDNCIIAPNVHILAHDASTKLHLGYTRLGRVIIGERVFIGAESIILPGITVGDNAIIAAGSVVTRDVVAGSVVGGNPARLIGQVSDFVKKNRELMKTRICYSQNGWHGDSINAQRREEQWASLEKPGFIE